MCAYLRRYHTIEFITAFLNNAANDDDISGGTMLARLYGIRITSPKWRFSRSEYYFTREENVIAKGLASVKYIGRSVAETMYRLSQGKRYEYFTDLLSDAFRARLDTRQLQILISIDYFSEFGNQRELFQIAEMFELFKRGSAKQVRRERIDGTAYEAAVRAHSTWATKSGEESKSYTLSDPTAIIHECEAAILALGLSDVDAASKARAFTEIMGYAGYSSGLEEDRRKLYVREVFPVCRKRDGKQFGYNILTQSIGSGIEGRFTIYNRTYEKDPVKKGDFIFCDRYVQEGRYFELAAYHHL